VAIAAKKLGKPVKMQLDRITDMEMYAASQGCSCCHAALSDCSVAFL
jgi:xanthine dehydrogenase molybdopterin-binding subunit B